MEAYHVRGWRALGGPKSDTGNEETFKYDRGGGRGGSLRRWGRMGLSHTEG